MSFWRKEVIDFALDRETQSAIEEQRAWILREPANPKPYYHLAQLYRVAFKPEEALGLLLEAVRLDPDFAEAHASLAKCMSSATTSPPPGVMPASPGERRPASRGDACPQQVTNLRAFSPLPSQPHTGSRQRSHEHVVGSKSSILA